MMILRVIFLSIVLFWLSACDSDRGGEVHEDSEKFSVTVFASGEDWKLESMVRQGEGLNLVDEESAVFLDIRLIRVEGNQVRVGVFEISESGPRERERVVADIVLRLGEVEDFEFGGQIYSIEVAVESSGSSSGQVFLYEREGHIATDGGLRTA
ncbi:MAG: hypothetical protein AAF481_10230 [Acidobacteriota bacterium]